MESDALRAAASAEAGAWVIGPGKHEGRGIEEVIVQRKLNTHIYFKSQQFIWESEIEAGSIWYMKADLPVLKREVWQGYNPRLGVQSWHDPLKRKWLGFESEACGRIQGSAGNPAKAKGASAVCNGVPGT